MQENFNIRYTGLQTVIPTCPQRGEKKHSVSESNTLTDVKGKGKGEAISVQS